MPVSSLSIPGLRRRAYGSRLSLAKVLDVPAKGFRSFLLSYSSDGLTVFARLNVPIGGIPEPGFPTVVFAHGFSPEPMDPNYFQRPYYERWTDAYAEEGFLVLMPGYRGHGVVNGVNADGAEDAARYAGLHLTSPFYAIDLLNLVAGLPTLTAMDWGLHAPYPPAHPLVDGRNLYLVGHSMGGDVALTALTVTEQFKAASIWAGVCASVRDVTQFYTEYEITRTPTGQAVETAVEEKLAAIAAAMQAAPFNLDDVNALNGYCYLDDLSTGLVIHQGTRDPAIPTQWCLNLQAELKRRGKASRLFLYEGNDHELSLNDAHTLAIQRDVAFFKEHFQPQ